MTGSVLRLFEAHPIYAWTGVGLVLSLWLILYFRFRVMVPENCLLYFGDPHLRKEPGHHFMPYVYQIIDVRPRTIEIGADELQTVSRVDTYREGLPRPQKESVVNRVAARPKKPYIVKWQPARSQLGDYVQHEHSHELERRVKEFFRLGLRPNVASLESYLEDFRLGVDIMWVYGPEEERKAPTVSLADNVEIPYEG